MKPRRMPPFDELFQGVREGDRIALARAITIVESTRPEDREVGARLIEACLPHSGKGSRIGVTGAPGAGKSTFIEAWGRMLTGRGHKVAVLAIDPSSGVHRGSILGDKTRMEELSRDPSAFIRPSPSGATLGGVARKTRETILICEAAGYDHILIETVGVGQSETAVHAMTDLFLLLLLPGAGDALQGIKRGIVEMADMVVINKADGERIALAEEARQQYRQALHLFPAHPSGQTVEVFQISAWEKTGLDIVDNAIRDWIGQTRLNGYHDQRRREQNRYWLRESLRNQLTDWVFTRFADDVQAWEERVIAGTASPFLAADDLMRKITGV